MKCFGGAQCIIPLIFFCHAFFSIPTETVGGHLKLKKSVYPSFEVRLVYIIISVLFDDRLVI